MIDASGITAVNVLSMRHYRACCHLTLLDSAASAKTEVEADRSRLHLTTKLRTKLLVISNNNNSVVVVVVEYFMKEADRQAHAPVRHAAMLQRHAKYCMKITATKALKRQHTVENKLSCCKLPAPTSWAQGVHAAKHKPLLGRHTVESAGKALQAQHSSYWPAVSKQLLVMAANGLLHLVLHSLVPMMQLSQGVVCSLSSS